MRAGAPRACAGRLGCARPSRPSRLFTPLQRAPRRAQPRAAGVGVVTVVALGEEVFASLAVRAAARVLPGKLILQAARSGSLQALAPTLLIALVAYRCVCV